MSSKNTSKDIPDPPKKYMSTYFLFASKNWDKVDEIRKRHNVFVKKPSKLIRMAYNALDDKEREVLQKEVDKLRAKYEKDLEKYVKEYGPVKPRRNKSKEEPKDEVVKKTNKSNAASTSNRKSPKPKK